MTQTAQETARTTSAAPSTPTPARNGSTDLTVRSASPNRVTGQDQMDKGVVVQVGDVECIVDLSIVVDYEASIPRVAEAIRRNIASRLGAMTGLETKEVNINVADLYFADNAKGQVAPQHEQPAVR